MPQVFRIGAHRVCLWPNEGAPLKPVHVHVSKGSPAKDTTKVWVTVAGERLVRGNGSRMPGRVLRNVCRIIESRSDEVVERWRDRFGSVHHYC